MNFETVTVKKVHFTIVNYKIKSNEYLIHCLNDITYINQANLTSNKHKTSAATPHKPCNEF